MLEPPAVIREDFDRIARVSREAWNQNNPYHPFLLRQLPSRFREALDIGCGKGAFFRLLANRSDRVTAVDLSPEMIRPARQRSAQLTNIDFQTADILEWPWPLEKFDGIASIAALHHPPLE
jgi:2-polyprenyl-3-methyl-5-hydroxy-6-metoxy-1,4-benzoquinol methylase